MDELMGRWHRLSEQSRESVAAMYNDEGRFLLESLRLQALGEKEPACFASAEEFAEYVVGLRANEKAWSNRLGQVLLQSDELVTQKRPQEAQQVFRDFIEECPWRPFWKIAETQLKNIGG